MAKPLILILIVILLGLIVPKVEDPVLKIGVFAYAGIIGMMFYNAINLSTQESALNNNQHAFPQIYFLASLTFLISDTILGLAKFVWISDQTFWIMVTYYLSLYLFGISAHSKIPGVKEA